MESKVIDKTLILRADRGEDLLEALREACEQHHVKLGVVTGIGAVDRAVVGAFSVETQEYTKHTYENMEMEILSFVGNISTMNGEYYGHIHATVGLPDGTAVGGHANELRISATSEVFVQIIQGEVDRAFDERVGLNTIRF